MRHRTQLYLDDDQYRWLKGRAGRGGSIAGVVRDLIDNARAHRPDPSGDPLIRYLFFDPPTSGSKRSSADELDREIYGSKAP